MGRAVGKVLCAVQVKVWPFRRGLGEGLVKRNEMSENGVPVKLPIGSREI